MVSRQTSLRKSDSLHRGFHEFGFPKICLLGFTLGVYDPTAEHIYWGIQGTSELMIRSLDTLIGESQVPLEFTIELSEKSSGAETTSMVVIHTL
jgi:hypothetical protein